MVQMSTEFKSEFILLVLFLAKSKICSLARLYPSETAWRDSSSWKILSVFVKQEFYEPMIEKEINQHMSRSLYSWQLGTSCRYWNVCMCKPLPISETHSRLDVLEAPGVFNTSRSFSKSVFVFSSECERVHLTSCFSYELVIDSQELIQSYTCLIRTLKSMNDG